MTLSARPGGVHPLLSVSGAVVRQLSGSSRSVRIPPTFGGFGMDCRWKIVSVAGVLVWLASMALAPAAPGAPLPPFPAQPLGVELLVNQFASGEQVSPDIGMRDDGLFVVVWTSQGQDGDGDAIVQRRFAADGSTTFNESVLNQQTAGDQSAARLSMNGSGDLVAVWNTSASGGGLRGRATASNGSVFGGEFQASVATTGSFQSPSVSRAEDDSFVVVWKGTTPVFRRFSAAGTATTGDLGAALSTASPSRGAVAAQNDGTFVIAFDAVDDADLGVYVERFAANSLPDALPVAVAEAPDHVQIQADVGSASNGSFAVTWLDNTLGLRLRCFTADGVPASAEIGVFAGIGSIGRLAVAPDGAIVVTFDGAEVQAREFDRTCQPVTDAFVVNQTIAGNQQAPSVAAGRQSFAVVWESSGVDGSARGIMRRVYLLRSIFADRFESADLTAWSAAVP